MKMKNPFKLFRKNREEPTAPQPEIPAQKDEEAVTPTSPAPKEEPKDDFIEWCRSQIHGGIERRERNDIFEAYSVYGTDPKGQLLCRCYHRYPEHEREFDLSYTRALTFDEFNRRLLSELDKGDLRLTEYHDCIRQAEALTGTPSDAADAPFLGFSEEEKKALSGFCDALDTLKDKTSFQQNGVFRCEGESVIGEERINIRFRKRLPHDATDTDTAGVSMTEIGGYDITDLWIMGVYNRLRDRCHTLKVSRLQSEWSIRKETLYLVRVLITDL